MTTTTTAVAASEAAGYGGDPSAPSLDEFLTVDDTVPGQTTAMVGRLVGHLGVTLGIGALAFVATALRGRRQEVRRALVGVRVPGAVISLCAAIEYVGVTRISAGSLESGWSTAPGFATVLRAAGGGLMAFLVLDSIGDLTGTQWGKLLVLKTAAVGLAIVGGAYNHFRLLPALEADPESPDVFARLRSTVTAEAMMLVFVVIVTAFLVVAAA